MTFTPIKNHDLRPHNSLALPARARFFVKIDSLAVLQQARLFALEHRLPILILGAGSNVILRPYFDGLVLWMALGGQDWQPNRLHGGAGENWHDLVQKSVQKGYANLARLALIPGTLGAAPVQNIGAYGAQVGDFIEEIKVMDWASGQYQTLKGKDCAFGYRDSIFKQTPQRFVIVGVTLALYPSAPSAPLYPQLAAYLKQPNPTAQAVFDGVCALRRAKLPDPKTLANAGSFFTNPVVSRAHLARLQAKFPNLVFFAEGENIKLAAAWLIENAGFKGKRCAAVGMHAQQALVLVNYANASCEEVLAFAAQVQARVLALYQVQLKIEPQIY